MQTFTIDDENPAIVYSAGDGWRIGPTTNVSTRTSHSTTVPGASFSFTFQGTSVSVHGTLGPNRTPQAAIVSTYVIDNSSEVFTGIQGATSQLQILFYSSPVLPDGIHTLVATFASAPVGELYIFDYLICTSSLADPLPSAAQTQSGIALSSTRSTVDGRGADIKVLVPAIVVPICVVLLLVLAGFYSLQGRRSRESEKSVKSVPDADVFYPNRAHIAPYPTSSVLSSSPFVRPSRVSSNAGSEDDLGRVWVPDTDDRTRATVATTFTDGEGGRGPDAPLSPMRPKSVQTRYWYGRERPNETGPESAASSADAPPPYASNG